MDLRELGTMLREERERQGLSIEEVSDKIKITRSCLTAIEEGNQSVLPHPVYAKGFIKNYAKLLGVDQDEFARRLSEVYQPEELSLHEAPILRDVPDDDCGCAIKPASKFPLVPSAIVLVVVLVVAGLGWYLYAHVFARPAGQTDKAAPTASVEPAAPKPEADAARPVPTVPATQPTESSPAAPAPTPAVTPPSEPAPTAMPEPTPEDRATQAIATSGPTAESAPAPVPTAPEPAPATPPTTAVKTFAVGDKGPHTVVITANGRCWVQAGADGGTMREAMLEKGDVFNGRFADYLLVRLGNAGAVEIRFDNKLYPLQATKGAVKTLKFVAKKTEDEAATATPPSETPAAAAPASATATPATAPAATTPAAGENPTAAKEVEIYGQDGSWVIVNPDKGPSKEIYVKKGQRLTVPFDEKIEIRLGNPSNVVFRYDGKDMPVMTEKGESKTVRFP